MKAAWRQPGGLPECPYFNLTLLPLPRGYSLRVHEWNGDDDRENLHDHGHWFWTLVLRGGYIDVSQQDDRLHYEVMVPGMLRFRKAEHTHQVVDVKPGTITLLLCGPDTRRWGFTAKARGKHPRKRMRRDKYFAEIGHHGCQEGDRVRMRPDGSRIEVLTSTTTTPKELATTDAR